MLKVTPTITMKEPKTREHRHTYTHTYVSSDLKMLYEVREFLASYDATPVMVMATIPVASKRICGLAVRDEIFFGRLGGKFEKLRNLNLS